MTKNLKKRFVLNCTQLRTYHYLRSQLFLPSSIELEKAKSKESANKSISNLILEKNGFLDDSAPGLVTFLPLGKRVLNKMINIIRDEMNRIGGQEISMPSLSDLNLWKQTGRDEIIGNELFKLKDRKDRSLCLCPTHEEIVTSLVSKYSKMLNSKCLGESQALLLYQITPKFRDEPHPKHGLLRAREFLMKDMYTFHLSEECAQKTYDKVCKAYEAVFNRIDLNFIRVAASSGAMGGSMSHEYHIQSVIGEDTVFQCKKCSKAISNDLINEKNDKNICNIIKCGNSNTDDVTSDKKTCIEIGHTFILGDRYTKIFPINSKKSNKDERVVMGCYGIGVSRVIQACIESKQEDNLYPNWPLEIAPYQIMIIPPKKGSKEEKLSDDVLKTLITSFEADVNFKDEIIVDDRNTSSIGSRIIDAKLIGTSYIIVLGRLINENKIEIIINSSSIKNVINKTSIECSIQDAVKTIKEFNSLYYKNRF